MYSQSPYTNMPPPPPPPPPPQPSINMDDLFGPPVTTPVPAPHALPYTATTAAPANVYTQAPHMPYNAAMHNATLAAQQQQQQQPQQQQLQQPQQQQQPYMHSQPMQPSPMQPSPMQPQTYHSVAPVATAAPEVGGMYAHPPPPASAAGAGGTVMYSHPPPGANTVYASTPYYATAQPMGVAATTLPPATAATPPLSTPAARTQEDEDKAQLEKIIRLRRELELEQERERQKLEELQTWGCSQCTFRNKLTTTQCEMCGLTRPGFASKTAASSALPATSSTVSASGIVAPATTSSSSSAEPSYMHWQCSICSTVNGFAQNRCTACNAYRHTGVPVHHNGNATTRITPPAAAAAAAASSAASAPFTCNWRCGMCGSVNAPQNARCGACNAFQRNGTPAPGADAQYTGTGGSSHGGDGAAAATTWQCSVCTLENAVSVPVCTACHSGQRPRHLAPAKEHRSKKSDGGHSNNHHHSSSSGSGSGAREWPCETCTFINPVTRTKCDMCGAVRPARYAPAAGAASEQARRRREEESDEEEVQWQDDNVADSCNRCHQEFGLLRRRHHCRACGYVFCATCSPYKMALKKGGEVQRVCVSCYEARQQDKRS